MRICALLSLVFMYKLYLGSSSHSTWSIKFSGARTSGNFLFQGQVDLGGRFVLAHGLSHLSFRWRNPLSRGTSIPCGSEVTGVPSLANLNIPLEFSWDFPARANEQKPSVHWNSKVGRMCISRDSGDIDGNP